MIIRKISPVIFITISLVVLTTGILIAANLLGIVPDDLDARLQARAKIAEALAVQFSAYAENSDYAGIQRLARLMSERNDDIISIAIKQPDGEILASTEGYIDNSTERSSTDFLHIPVYENDAIWAMVEVRFKHPYSDRPAGYIGSPFVKLLVFVASIGFIIYLMLMRRVLRHLDPFSVIPARVRAVMNIMSEGVCLVDNEDNIVLVNKAFETKTGRTFAELTRVKLSSLDWINAEQKSYRISDLPWHSLLSGQDSFTHAEIKYKYRGSNSKTFILSGASIRDNSKKLRGALITFDDVTEIEEKNRQLQQQQVIERQRIQWLEGIASLLRHEMNTALLGASTSVLLLERSGKLDDDSKHLTGLASKSHDVIRSLLDSVSQATSFESAFLQEEQVLVDIGRTIKSQVDSYKYIYPDGIILTEIDDKELQINGREERIAQLLDKLVDNAVSYSIEGTPVVITAKRKRRHIIISVSNTGPLLPDHSQDIFNLFASFRKNNSESNHGIGLYIVKVIAEGYGGSVAAKNRGDDTGVEFIVTLPASV